MLFNSIDFVIFLPLVFIIYWVVGSYNLRLQNVFIILSSYIFYGWWDWRFLSLIFLSTIVDYSVGIGMRNNSDRRKKKFLLAISIVVNLSLLGFFKYYNFFLENFIDAFSFLGYGLGGSTLEIILPVGISFYTFQTLSYSIDIYRGKLEPTNDIIAFAAFVSFFPQLVAGPIERAKNLLPQITTKRYFVIKEGMDGIRLGLWGFFKKIVIADSLAPSVNHIFANYQELGSGILILGAVFFSFQIYCDFSGYSDIARGIAKLLGIDLMVNFNFPYFSRGIAEFWRKWHISLSTWFRDYLYIPLGGSRGTTFQSIRNVFVIFVVSGFWHGANWTFLIWGTIHAFLFVPSFISNTNRVYLDDLRVANYFLPALKEIVLIIKTYLLVTIAWVFFRAPTVYEAMDFLNCIIDWSSQKGTFLNPYDNQPLFKEYFYLIAFIAIEYLLVTNTISLFSKKLVPSLIVDATFILLIIINSPINNDFSFIYFQF